MTAPDCEAQCRLSGRSLGLLDEADQLLVWALRRRRRDRAVSEVLRRGFALALPADLAAPALDAFEALHRAIAEDARRPLALGCLHCGLVAADEQAVLDLVAATLRRDAATAALALVDPPAAARLAALAEALAASLDGTALRRPQPRAARRASTPPRSAPCAPATTDLPGVRP